MKDRQLLKRQKETIDNKYHEKLMEEIFRLSEKGEYMNQSKDCIVTDVFGDYDRLSKYFINKNFSVASYGGNVVINWC